MSLKDCPKNMDQSRLSVPYGVPGGHPRLCCPCEVQLISHGSSFELLTGCGFKKPKRKRCDAPQLQSEVAADAYSSNVRDPQTFRISLGAAVVISCISAVQFFSLLAT